MPDSQKKQCDTKAGFSNREKYNQICFELVLEQN